MKGRKGLYVFTVSEYENTDCLRIRLGGEEAYIPMRDIYDAANEHKKYVAAKARIDAMPEEEREASAESGQRQKLYTSVEHGATVVSWDASVPDSGTSGTKGKSFAPMPNSTPEQLNDPVFLTIWEVIKHWDVNVPQYYEGYCGATGSHVMLIWNALHQLWRSQ